MTYKILGVLVFGLLISSATAQERERDGNWWIIQSQHDQIIYLMGFIDGTVDGSEQAIQDDQMQMMTGNSPCKTTECAKSDIWFGMEIRKTIQKDETRYDNVTIGQMIDGLNAIYSDYRNRGIDVTLAQEVALEAIHGESQETVEKRLEFFRKLAAGN